MTASKWWALLRCPLCKGALRCPKEDRGLSCEQCGKRYRILDGIPRFVADESYAGSFGYQWKRFRRVQLDSYNGTEFSHERFFSITGWSPEELRGKLVLDAGCGSGRFVEVSLECGANLVAVDLSEAIEACSENVESHSAFLCQASLYELPFEKETFDYVYCIGVIQHTPDPPAAVKALGEMVKPGGQLGLWMYELDWKSYLGTTGFKYLLRPLVKRWKRDTQMEFSEKLTRTFWPLVRWAKARGLLGKLVMRLLPVASAHLHAVGLKVEDFRTWVLLDTFDMYSPMFDYPQRFGKIAELLQGLGFEDIRRHPHGGISITGTKKRLARN
jgi:2-polyprenyl-3-methyl-5-hydroxy-6-metoxy-1,4-benzoquinol methylase